MLGNQGWENHQIWAAFDTPVEALTFLENFYQTPEFQTYSELIVLHHFDDVCVAVTAV